MDRYELQEDCGNFFIYDNELKKTMCISEATSLLNDLMSMEERKEFQEFVKQSNGKIRCDLLDKTLEILMMPIMGEDIQGLIKSVEALSRGNKADSACANLLRRAIYLKSLANGDIE